MIKDNTYNKRNIILVAIIWPIMGLIMAIKHYNKFNTKNIILYFCVLFGFTFVIDETMDGDRYAQRLKDDYGKTFSESALNEHISGLYETSLDFVQPVINFIVSRFTDSHHVLFAVYALIFGYFWLKTIDFVNKRVQLGRNKLTIVYTIFLISLIPIFNINGFRMWTAAWIFIYGALHVVVHKDWRYLLVSFAACTVHFSFLTVNLILLLWLFVGNHKWIYLGIALVTFAISELDLAIVRSYAQMISPALESKANAYASDAYADNVAQLRGNDAWFMQLSPMFTRYLLLLNLLLMIFVSIKKKLPKSELNLLNFTLLFLAYANIANLVPSGGRFMTVYFVFATILSIVLFSKYYYRRLDSPYGLISLGVVLLSVLITFRVAAPTLNTILFAPSILIPFGYDLDWPLTDWLF